MGHKPALPPIIIIGMHRSGTTMITRLLQKLGLFVGKNLDDNCEPLFFANLNNWLMRCGGEWDYPGPTRELVSNATIRKYVIDHLGYFLKSPRVATFLGFSKYLRYRTPMNLEVPWGWKDPRNTYTLPLWLDLFPRAKVINIYRHGIDVANSLRVRAEKALTNNVKVCGKKKFCYWLKRRPEPLGTLRCLSLDGAFALWEEYVVEAHKHAVELQGQAIEVKYEDFLSDPSAGLRGLASFAGLPCNEADIAKVVSQVKKERAYGYRQVHELRVYETHVSERLKALGY